MSSKRISHVTMGKTEKKLEMTDIMLNFHFSEEKDMPVAIFTPTVKISTSLESSFTSNSISMILLLLPSDVKEFCTELSDTDKSCKMFSERKFLTHSEYSSYSFTSACKSLSMDCITDP
ncbi:hypothetical protein ACJW31_04G131700 [Castanea mollissima]